jgi:hypothetical protein
LLIVSYPFGLSLHLHVEHSQHQAISTINIIVKRGLYVDGGRKIRSVAHCFLSFRSVFAPTCEPTPSHFNYKYHRQASACQYVCVQSSRK